MRVLVTGGSGFIGSHVVEALVARGHAVRSLDLVAPARQGPTSVEHVVGDIRDRETVAACLNRVVAVLHHAAKVGMGRDVGDLPDYVSVNDYGTAVLLDAATRRGIGRVVLASSMVVYGEGAYWCSEHGAVRPAARAIADLAGGQFDPRCPACGESLQSETVAEGAPFEPRSSYAATKLAQEHLCGVWARETGGTVVALRYHNVYGPRMPRDTPTPASHPLSARPWHAASRRRSTRMAGSGVTSSTSVTWRRPTWLPWSTRRPCKPVGCVPTTSPLANRARCSTWHRLLRP